MDLREIHEGALFRITGFGTVEGEQDKTVDNDITQASILAVKVRFRICGSRTRYCV